MNVSANPTLSFAKWLPLPFLFPLAVSMCPTISPSPLLYCSYPPAASDPSLSPSQPPLCSPLSPPFNRSLPHPVPDGNPHICNWSSTPPPSNILISISDPPPPPHPVSPFISILHLIPHPFSVFLFNFVAGMLSAEAPAFLHITQLTLLPLPPHHHTPVYFRLLWQTSC